MRTVRRVTAAVIGAGVGFAAGGASLARVVPVFASSNCAPIVSAISPQHGPAGQTITITGDNFNCTGNGSSVSVQIGNGPTTAVGATTGTTITVTPSAAQYGELHVSGTPGCLFPPCGGGSTSSATLVYVTNPTGVSLSGSWQTPTPGSTISGSGSGLSLGGRSLGLSVSYTNQSGSCPGPATVGSSDTGFSFRGPGQYCSANVVISEIFYGNGNSNLISFPVYTSPQKLVVQPGSASLNTTEIPAGSALQVSGSGFGQTNGTVSFGSIASWTDSNISITVPDTAVSGQQLQVNRAGDNATILSPTAITVDSRADSISPTTASIGDTVTISGGGFGVNKGSVTLGSANIAPSSWSPTQIAFTVPANAQGGTVQIAPVDTKPPANAPSLNIQAKLTGISPTHVKPNNYVQINGSGFGTNKGTVTLDGYSLPVTVWGDSQIVVLIPSQTVAGSYPLAVTPPGQNTVSTTLTIDPVPASSQSVTGGGSSSSSSSSSSASASKTPGVPGTVNGLILPGANGPIVAHGPVNFTKPPKPASPVNLTLSTAADTADPGQDVPFTVTLIAFGKPVAGATVDLTMVVVPGTDAKITPSQAVTDSQGRVSGVVHLSKTAGDHIILAKSGTTSDEVRLVGRGAATSDSGSGITSVTDVFTAGPSKMLLIVASAGCLVLFLTGFAIQMILPRRSRTLAAQPATGGSYVVARRRRSLFGRIVRIPQAVAVLAQYTVLALIIVPAQLVARVHR